MCERIGQPGQRLLTATEKKYGKLDGDEKVNLL